MKYAIRLLLRFSSKTARDKFFTDNKQHIQSKKLFKLDDSFIEKHICYHDETPSKPCKVEKTYKRP